MSKLDAKATAHVLTTPKTQTLLSLVRSLNHTGKGRGILHSTKREYGDNLEFLGQFHLKLPDIPYR